jgi:hypothetical protein
VANRGDIVVVYDMVELEPVAAGGDIAVAHDIVEVELL